MSRFTNSSHMNCFFYTLYCFLIICLFAFVVLRGFSRVWRESDLFMVLAVSGLLTQFGIQAVINMGVAVNLFPAKGMTLPFLSYGGSSVVAIALGMGMMLGAGRLICPVHQPAAGAVQPPQRRPDGARRPVCLCRCTWKRCCHTVGCKKCCRIDGNTPEHGKPVVE